MRQIDKLVTEYTRLKSEMADRKKQVDNIREDIANYMHKMKTNELIATGYNDIKYKCKYQSKSRKSVNYTVLSEIVDLEDYNRIVTKSKSDALIVRKAPKKSEKSKTNIAPKVKKEKAEIPMGDLS